MNFEELGLRKEVRDALKDMGIEAPTDIQQKVIAEGIQGRDVIGISKTGSGKTLAFAVPILEKVVPGRGIQAVILVPTRELAEQVMKEMKKFSKYLHLHIISVYGGVGMEPQIHGMKRADIVVATPGRMLDHLMSGNVAFPAVKVFVLDEADRMVSMGFIEDVEKIMSQVPRDRQVLLFGATISEEINGLKAKEMKDPVIKKAEVFVEQKFLDQYYYDVDTGNKFSLFVHLLKKENPSRAMVFCGTRVNADVVSRNLKQQGVDADVLHGKMSQSKRLRVIEGFHQGKPRILVATDVAARGLHIEDVSHIFNYDVPQNPEDYIHRVGRTARAGESGKAITMLSQRDYENFDAVLSRYAVNIKRGEKEEFRRIAFDSRQQDRDHGRFGSRRPMHGRSSRPPRSGGYGEPRRHDHSRHSGGSMHPQREKQHWVITKVE